MVSQVLQAPLCLYFEHLCVISILNLDTEMDSLPSSPSMLAEAGVCGTQMITPKAKRNELHTEGSQSTQEGELIPEIFPEETFPDSQENRHGTKKQVEIVIFGFCSEYFQRK